MSDEENFYFFDKEELEELLRSITSATYQISCCSNLTKVSYEDLQKWVKEDIEIYLKNIIDSKNKTGEFMPKSDLYAFVKEKVK